MSKEQKEENEIKGKVIAVQQKLLEIAIQMYQEKKDECEELKAKNDQHDDVEGELYAKLEWQEQQLESLRRTKSELLITNGNLRIQIEELKGGKDNG